MKIDPDKKLDVEQYNKLIQEGAEIREQINTSAIRLLGVYQTLYEKVRRQPSNDDTASYILLSKAGQRFSSSIIQGSQRVYPFERRIVGITEQRKRDIEAEETRILQDLREATDLKRKEVEQAKMVSDSDFLSLYGENFE